MRATVNGITVDYEFGGPKKAPWVTLIHGFPFNRAMWKSQVDTLKSTFRVLTYDLRGLGKSTLGKAPQPLEAYVDDLFALMDRLKISKTALCGLSMGGYIALRAIEREPARVSALALCDTRPDADSNEAKLKRAAGIKTLRAKGVPAFCRGMIPNLMLDQGKPAKALLKIMQSNKADGMANALVAMQGRSDCTAVLDRIRVPVLVICGMEDKLTPLPLAAAMAASVPGSSRVSIPNAGHVSNLDNPGDFNRALSGFLKGALC